jgi:hypothetical protein
MAAGRIAGAWPLLPQPRRHIRMAAGHVFPADCDKGEKRCALQR